MKFGCPQCGGHIECGPGYSGARILCPHCSQPIAIPCPDKPPPIPPGYSPGQMPADEIRGPGRAKPQGGSSQNLSTSNRQAKRRKRSSRRWIFATCIFAIFLVGTGAVIWSRQKTVAEVENELVGTWKFHQRWHRGKLVEFPGEVTTTYFPDHTWAEHYVYSSTGPPGGLRTGRWEIIRAVPPWRFVLVINPRTHNEPHGITKLDSSGLGLYDPSGGDIGDPYGSPIAYYHKVDALFGRTPASEIASAIVGRWRFETPTDRRGGSMVHWCKFHRNGSVAWLDWETSAPVAGGSWQATDGVLITRVTSSSAAQLTSGAENHFQVLVPDQNGLPTVMYLRDEASGTVSNLAKDRDP